MGVFPPSEVAKQVRNLKLTSGEALVGFWVDHYFANGVIALIAKGKETRLAILTSMTPGGC